MQQLREAARAAGIPELEMSVGIHTGFLSGGLVGSRNRPQFTVIGDTVNDAARVESFGHLSNYSPPLITRVMTSEKTALLLEGSARVEEKCFAQTEKYTGRIYEVLALLKQSV
jgi:adenylate cyclase